MELEPVLPTPLYTRTRAILSSRSSPRVSDSMIVVTVQQGQTFHRYIVGFFGFALAVFNIFLMPVQTLLHCVAVR